MFRLFPPRFFEEMRRQVESGYQRDWREEPISENCEPLVEVPKEHCYPYYHSVMKLTEESRIFLRRSVCDRFLSAHKLLLLAGYDLMLYDGWHSVELQERLFYHYMRQFTIPFLGLGDEFPAGDWKETKRVFEMLGPNEQLRIHAENRKYVSIPSKDPACPSPHATGAAADVWVWQDGVPLDLGCKFDELTERAGAFYHLSGDRPKFENEERVCMLRSMLLQAMCQSNFSAYPYEIWHFNSGNQMDAAVRGAPAQYSYIEPR